MPSPAAGHTLEQEGLNLKYRCMNYLPVLPGAQKKCSKARDEVIIELLPDVEAKCPECGLPLVQDSPRGVLARVASWTKTHRLLVGVVAVMVLGAVGGAEVWRMRNKHAATPVAPTLVTATPVTATPVTATPDAAKEASARALVNTAVLHLVKGELREADEQLDKALEQNPKEATAYLNRAIIRARQNYMIEALENVDKAFDAGFNDLKALERDTDFRTIRSRPEYRKLLAKHPEVLEKHPDIRAKYKLDR